MKIKTIVAIIISSILLSGCVARTAMTEQMIFHQPKQTQVCNTKLSKRVAVGDVQGGKETHPLLWSTVNNANFKAALEQSLKEADLLATEKPAYRVDVKIVKFRQPWFEFGKLSINSTVQYRIVDLETGKEVFDQEIKAKYSAKFSDAFLGQTRFRLAKEGSIKNNIGSLIQELNKI